MNKTRDQIRRKFKALEKKHPHLAAVIFEGPNSNKYLFSSPAEFVEMRDDEEEDYFFGE